MWLNPKDAEKVLAQLMKLPKPAPIIMTAQIVQDYAREIRRRLTEKSKAAASYVCQPLLNCTVLDQVSEAPSIVWLHFNPAGPTYSQLCVVPVPDANEMLLTLYGDHLLDTRRAVFGLLSADDTTVFLKALRSATTELALNDGDEICPLFCGLPTSVLHRENWCGSAEPPLLSAEFAREFFWTYAKDTCAVTSLAKSCYYLQKFKGAPRERTIMELDEGGKYLREIMVGKPEHAIGEQRQIERSEFDRWFDLVTDSSHVSSEVDNFKNAWLSAVDHTDIDIFNIRKLDALLRLQKLFLWEEITSGFNRDEVAQNPAQYLAMAVKYRQAEKENSTRRKAQNESSARRMASRAAHLAQDASNLNYAADIMEEAFEKGSVLKNEFQDKVKLWRRGISK